MSLSELRCHLPSPELPDSDEITIVARRRPSSEDSEDSGCVVLTSVKTRRR